MQRDRAGDERRESIEQAVARLRIHGADLRSATDAPLTELRVGLDSREHRIRHEVSESAFGRAPEQGLPLAKPADTQTEQGLRRTPRQRRTGRRILPCQAFRGERSGAQAGCNREGCNQAASGKREVIGLCCGGCPGFDEIQGGNRAVGLPMRLEDGESDGARRRSLRPLDR